MTTSDTLPHGTDLRTITVHQYFNHERAAAREQFEKGALTQPVYSLLSGFYRELEIVVAAAGGDAADAPAVVSALVTATMTTQAIVDGRGNDPLRNDTDAAQWYRKQRENADAIRAFSDANGIPEQIVAALGLHKQATGKGTSDLLTNDDDVTSQLGLPFDPDLPPVLEADEVDDDVIRQLGELQPEDEDKETQS